MNQEADFGMIVSLLGTDVDTASDQQQLWNSGWPLLKQNKEPIAVPDPNAGVDSEASVAHGLDYPPLIWTFSGVANEPQGYQLDPNTEFDATNIHSSYSYPPTGITRLSYVYRLDLTKDYTSPIKTTTFRSPTSFDDDFGIKILKSSAEDIDSKDLRDYAIHSGARSPLVHMVRYQALSPIDGGVGGYGCSVAHGLPYTPYFLIFAEIIDGSLIGDRPNGRWFQVYVGASGGVFVGETTNTTISFRSSVNAYKCTIVIFKDPFNIADGNNQSITI